MHTHIHTGSPCLALVLVVCSRGPGEQGAYKFLQVDVAAVACPRLAYHKSTKILSYYSLSIYYNYRYNTSIQLLQYMCSIHANQT
jgi:hypothetical protein